MKRIFCTVLVICCAVSNFLSFNSYATYEPPFKMECKSVYMVNIDTDTVVYELNQDKKVYPASLTKMMTAIIALEKVEDIDGSKATAKPYIFDELYRLNASTAGIVNGETLTIRQLLQCMLCQSACEAASIIADYICPDNIPGFVEIMNSKAKKIGAKNTNFTNPHGLHDKNQYTTAKDMTLIAKYAMDIPGFMEIVSQTEYLIPATNKRDSFSIYTTIDPMKKSSEYYYQPVKGIKTGTLSEGGRCFVSTATKDGFTYLCTVMGAPLYDEKTKKILPGNKAFEITNNLYKWAFETFKIKTLMEEGTPVQEVKLQYVFNKDHMKVSPEKRVSALIPDNVDASKIKMSYNLPEKVAAPIKKGQVLGTADLIFDGNKIGTTKLIATESQSRNWLLYSFAILGKMLDIVFFKMIVAAIIIFMILIMIINIINRNRKNRSKSRSKRKKMYYSDKYRNRK